MRTAGRVALWIAVAIVFVRGVGAIASGPSAPASGQARQTATAGFPDDEARAFAVQFVNAYLDPSRRGEMTDFFVDGLSDRAAAGPPRGPGAGVAWATVAREARLGGSRALITVASLSEHGSSRYVTVPVARDHEGGLAVYSLPSFVPPPARASLDSDAAKPLTGPGAEAISDLAERFVRAYVAGAGPASLAYLLLPGTRLAAMPPGLRLVSVDAVDQATPAQAGRRSVIVSVRVRETATGTVFPLAYRLAVERRDRWYVASVAGGPSA